ncbi:hypothetical protein RhiirA4_471266 [Rhizophagus irregularis]|uniref:Protein kinase domain-containing protein n=1 Tax=Rhizophagus irregularis TaxID=588596 RepID=A0A2I1H2T3_9GLOM|nr:hypothetical protein RhiirA4_471266 [Rhizophagus irregularis]
MILTVRDLQVDSKENVIRLQTNAKSEFEKQVDETKEKIANLDEDAIDEFVRNKFKTLNDMFLERSNQMEKYVLSKKPKKPEKNPNETNKEHENKYKEVLNKDPYTLASDIYSFGVMMTELSSGKPPFYMRKHNIKLALEIYNGIRPEFGKGTPEIYKELAYRCMNTNSNQRPTASELFDIIKYWNNCIERESYQKEENFGNREKEIRVMFEEADKEIPNIQLHLRKMLIVDAIYTSRVFAFNDLQKLINSSIIANEEDCQDSQLHCLEVTRSLDIDDGNVADC